MKMLQDLGRFGKYMIADEWAVVGGHFGGVKVRRILNFNPSACSDDHEPLFENLHTSSEAEMLIQRKNMEPSLQYPWLPQGLPGWRTRLIM